MLTPDTGSPSATETSDSLANRLGQRFSHTQDAVHDDSSVDAVPDINLVERRELANFDPPVPGQF